MSRIDDVWGNRRRDCPSDLVLDRYLLGEIRGTEEARLAAHIEACPACHRYVDGAAAFRGGDAEDRLVADIARKTDVQERPRTVPASSPLVFIASLAMAVAVIVSLPYLMTSPPEPPHQSPPTVTPTIRLKGATATLVLYRLVDGEPHRIGHNEPLRPGDGVQAMIRSASPAYAALYDHMEDRVERLAPAAAAPAIVLAPRQENALKPAFRVESVGPRERLVLVICPDPFNPADAPTDPDSFAGWLPGDGCTHLERAFVPTVQEPVP